MRFDYREKVNPTMAQKRKIGQIIKTAKGYYSNEFVGSISPNGICKLENVRITQFVDSDTISISFHCCWSENTYLDNYVHAIIGKKGGTNLPGTMLEVSNYWGKKYKTSKTATFRRNMRAHKTADVRLAEKKSYDAWMKRYEERTRERLAKMEG
jgi:hypothetical protein